MIYRRIHLALESCIVFTGAFLVAVLYYVAITFFLSGSWVAHPKLTDIPDMMIFAVSAAFVSAVLSREDRSLPEWLIACGFSIMAFNMCLAMFANRALAIDPDSGAGALFIPVLTLSTIAALMIIHGYTQRIHSKFEI